ncbi:ABC transporter permease [Geosporobacter ferrireducens]|uniref:ABC-2 type transporter transmembrane domain-containing protein n=1 Tax=Geosporobacter ferrireducens TaxID=1424294 RepID=A0A1D8GFE7_9FIRM|nr:ABC transporter permease [Geosporobacter ferrireducens]AOT69638.1 hypothetical protein Gferi_08635 [Geosporobacter ferrireducens]MTI54659.1 ABC transporter permease [Geosporobacter ferrireducens]
MKRLLGLLKKDFKIAFRNFFFLIVVVVAAILIFVTNILIPEQVNMEAKVFYALEGEPVHEILPLIQFLEKLEGNQRMKGRDEIIRSMEADQEAVGLMIRQMQNKPGFEIIMQGYESDQSKNAFALSIESILNTNQLNDPDIETVVLKQTVDYGKIPFNKSFVPLMILNEPVMLGFILLATLIFMEKEEDTIKAYMVSPGGIAEYLWSKVILIAVLGLISTILITIFTMGFKINWLMLISITIAGSLFSSTIAMFIASFFDNISKAMIWVLGISLLLTAPMISYFAPSFAPRILTVIPTYSLMFAIREAIFPSGNQAIFYESMVLLLILSAILFSLSILSYKRSLLRD